MAERVALESAAIWGECRTHALGRFRLIIRAGDEPRHLSRYPGGIGSISGYVRSEGISRAPEPGSPIEAAHNAAFFSEISRDEGWPLDDSWTGSFAAVAHATASGETLLCNDPIGFWPLYFGSSGGGLLGGTSLILLARCLATEVDLTGLLQRLTPPYCNYGKRTLLRGVERLLPGELVSWRGGKGPVRRVFDNSLSSSPVIESPRTIARSVFDRLRDEVRLSTNGETEVCVALSGGWDSRLLLPGISPEARIHAYTYGSSDLYESRIAARCAKAVGGTHECFPIEDRYFPPRARLEELVGATEAANYMEWNGMLQRGRSGADRRTLLLGDLCEGIDGRYMEELSSRTARRRSFAKGLLGMKEDVPESSPGTFLRWQRNTADQVLAATMRTAEGLPPSLRDLVRNETLHGELAEDLAASFARVESNQPKFRPVYDELFAWFHRIRFLLGSQIPLLDSGYRAISPGMAMGFVRRISAVHPAVRTRRRLMDAIAALPEFDRLVRIPSAQIPWVNARAPALLRELLWGARSGIDQLLIRRRMRQKDAERRQRVLPSLDYVREYRRPGTAEKVSEWFSGRWCSPAPYVLKVERRASLSSWPLINVDVVAPANVSLTLDLCRLPEGTDR